MALPRKNRLKGKKDFDYIFKNGNTAKGRFLLVKYVKLALKDPRIGFIVPVRVARRAVDRNRTKRILANNIQKDLSKINKDAVVLVLRLPPKESETGTLSQELNKLIPNLYE